MQAGPKPKRTTNLRWIILFFSLFSGFVFAYSYDTPAAIKISIQQHLSTEFTSDQFEIRYSLLYSIMALPNIFTSLMIGYFLDKFGSRINFLILSILLAIGTAVTSIGVAEFSFTAMCVGRFIQGITGQPVHIVEGVFLKQYFNSKKMGFIITIIQALSALGGFLTFIVSPRYALTNVIGAFEITSYNALINTAFIIGVCVVDKLIDWKTPRAAALPHEEEQERLVTPERRDDQSDSDQAPPEDAESQAKPGSLSDAFSFPITYWYLLMAAVATYSSIKTMIMVASSYVVEKSAPTGDLSDILVTAAATVSLFRLTSAIVLLFIEYILDWTGKRALWLLIAAVLSAVTHILMIFIPPMICFILYGLCYAIVSATIWPLVLNMLPKRHIGLGTGVINAIENIGLFAFPIVNGVIRAKTGSYDYSMIFLAILSILASLSAFKSYRMLRSEPEPRPIHNRVVGPSIAVA